MKIIKIITNPYLLILSFILILISGESFGGFYLLYILLALPHGGIHAILAVLGIGMLLFGFHKYKRQRIYRIESIFNIIGALLLFFSIFFFFYNDEGYNDATFQQVMPLVSIAIFSLLLISFLAFNIFYNPDGRGAIHDTSLR